MARITVEDCLEKENNRFALVQLAAKRTKQLLAGSRSLSSESKGNKVVVTALREIAEGQVRFMTEEDLEILRAKEEERLAQIQSEMEATSADDLFILPSELSGGSVDDDDDDEGDDSDDGELPVKKAAKEPAKKASPVSIPKQEAKAVEFDDVEVSETEEDFSEIEAAEDDIAESELSESEDDSELDSEESDSKKENLTEE